MILNIYRLVRHVVGGFIMNSYKYTAYSFFRLFPLQNKVVFSNFNGRGLGDDPKYIALSLHSISPSTKIIWLVNTSHISLPDFIIPAKKETITAWFHIATSRCWCSNSRGTFTVPKREGQFYIQTWHCTLGLKDSEGACPNLPLQWRRAAEKDSKKIDLMYSNNDITVNYYRHYFYNPGTVIKCDVPRVAFMKRNKELAEKIVRGFYGFDTTKKIILYAPTFRKTKDIDIYIYDFERVISMFSRKFGDSYILLFRLHPFFANLSKNIIASDNVINATDYPDMHELICASSILITDFSSCMFDMCFLRKPVFLFAKDFESYIENERNLIYNIKDLPFSISRSDKELLDNISLFNNDVYQSSCDAFFERIGMKDEGEGDDYIAKILYSKIFDEYKL